LTGIASRSVCTDAEAWVLVSALALVDVYTSTVEVWVALVAAGAAAPVPWAVDGVHALAERAPACVVRDVAPCRGAVADVPDGPVEDDRHRQVVAPVAVRPVAVTVHQPLGLH